MSISSTLSNLASSGWNSLPSSSSIIDTTADIIDTTADLVKNLTSYPMQESLSATQGKIPLPFIGSIFSKISEGTTLLREANPSYVPDMLNVQTALFLTATTLSAISLFAGCLKSKKISFIAKAGAYTAISGMLLASYQYLNIASCMGSSMSDNNSSILYRNCTTK